jgi:hypothetical protein
MIRVSLCPLWSSQVAIGPYACKTTIVDKDTLTCTTPNIFGNVRADYWSVENLPRYQDLSTLKQAPLLSRIEQEPSLGRDYGWGSPAPSVPADWFAGRRLQERPCNAAVGAYTRQGLARHVNT